MKRAYSSSASVREARAAFSPARASSIPFSTSSSVYLSDFSALTRSARAAAAVRRAISIWIGTSLRTQVQVGTLAAQLGERGIELGLRDVDLVAVRDRVDLRDDLSLGDAVVLIDQEADDPAGDHLRGDVDDVRLDEGVVGDRVACAGIRPSSSGAAGRRRSAR